MTIVRDENSTPIGVNHYCASNTGMSLRINNCKALALYNCGVKETRDVIQNHGLVFATCICGVCDNGANKTALTIHLLSNRKNQ